MKLIKNIQWIVPIIISAILLVACKKDKVPLPIPVPEPTKWEKISGHYKVYDTTGAFLYEMDIMHSDTTLSDNTHIDSLLYINFDGQYSFSSQQSNFTNYPNMIQIGVHNPVIDANNDRYRIFGYGPQNGFNNFVNDTIIFYFEKQNIQYYIQDVTPYFYCECKQVAVKQH